ncbi:interleukin-1 receptor-like 2 isoform 4-T7 [Ciconia maguari]
MVGKREKFTCLSWQNVGNMTAKPLFLCNITTAFLSLIIAEKCEAYDVMLKHILVPNRQPLAIKCSPEKSLKSGDYNLTWNEKNIQPVRWYKDCQLLEGERFAFSNSHLIIFNVTVHDQGNYTCETTYTYNGRQYNISRDVSLTVEVSPPKKPPEISYPRNNSIEVELGSQVTVDCNTTGADGYEVFWTGNGVYIDVFYMSRIFASPYEEETSYDGRPMHSVKLIISEVNSEDYEQPFVCQASNAFGQVASYIILKHKVPDIRRWLTGGLVSLLILTFITLIIYKIFKIDLVLWYRNSVCAFASKEGEVVKKVLQDDTFLMSWHLWGWGLLPGGPRSCIQVTCWHIRPHDGKRDGKIYDAYVLYAKSSGGRSFCRLETFVRRILPDVLEQQCGYNLFILGRDDLPGEAVVSVADETLKQSRRLMIILGSETSSCCLLEDTSEQQLAMYNALIRDGIQVILIEMDEIQDYTSMPESIKYIKQKHGAIQWKGDFSEKSCSANTTFWKNVRYRMPSRKKLLNNWLFSEKIQNDPKMSFPGSESCSLSVCWHSGIQGQDHLWEWKILETQRSNFISRRATDVLHRSSLWWALWFPPGDPADGPVTSRTAAVMFVLAGCIQPLRDGGAAAFLLEQDMEQRN